VARSPSTQFCRPLSKRDQPITAGELARQLASRPDEFSRRRQRQLDLERRNERYRIDAALVLASLARAGFAVNRIFDLGEDRRSYEEAVPILLEGLGCSGNKDVDDEILRVLAATKPNPAAARRLIEYFESCDRREELGLRWQAANALATVATDAELGEVAALLADARHGRAREQLLSALPRLKPREEAIAIARQTLAEGDLAGHAIEALRLMRASEARGDIEPFRNHPKTWVRREADRALRALDDGT
jgi:hypothetical protein